MRILILASSSSGNCFLVENNGDYILLDAGISMRRIKTMLEVQNISMNDVKGVLITHEHSDHISGLFNILKKYRYPVFAPPSVCRYAAFSHPENGELFNPCLPGDSINICSMNVKPFNTPHDTAESYGYRIEGEGTFALATDMGQVTDEIRNGLLGADTVVVESNHDVDMLLSGPYPLMLKRRILSANGHLSNEECAKLVRELAGNSTSRIVLGHLSKTNNTPRRAYEESAKMLIGLETELYVAPELGPMFVEVG